MYPTDCIDGISERILQLIKMLILALHNPLSYLMQHGYCDNHDNELHYCDIRIFITVRP